MVGGSERAEEEASPPGGRETLRAVSHNLRTPLAVIKGCTDMLLTHDLDDERRRELLLAASANVDRLAEAITWLEDSFERLARDTTIHLPDVPEQEGSA